VRFPFLCRNISAAPEYGVYVSQLIGYSRTSGSCHDFLDNKEATEPIVHSGYIEVITSKVFRAILNKRCSNKASVELMLKSSVQIFYDRHHNLVDLYKIYISQILMDNFLRRFCLSSVTDNTFIGLDFIYI